ncbi:MarR family winged helix-turn-helix transcriptional regulator [Leifsonia sp. NPDC058230]|uniref:MarR family winged helix-turn-helix transcriptional regulator n=1 Tax=Leifsonia sp. NPDC058230 TaxID=3346391 RepID=UPI0036D8D738
METKLNEARPDQPERRRRRAGAEIKRTLRELNNQVALLNNQVGARVDLRPLDLDCLDVVAIHGPLSPSELARRSGFHPATITGILDRLEKSGWIVRERDAADRRAVRVRALPDRAGELFHLYSGMNDSMDEIFADYDDAQLATLVDFLTRAAEAGRTATTDLSERADQGA